MAPLFRFRKGKAYGLGIGAEGLGLEQPQSLPLTDGFMTPRYMVRGDFAPLQGGQVKLDRGVTPVAVRGNGAQLSGSWLLQGLAKMMDKG